MEELIDFHVPPLPKLSSSTVSIGIAELMAKLRTQARKSGRKINEKT